MLKRKSVDLLLHKPRLRFRWHRWVAPAPPRIVTPTNVLGEPRGASLKNAPCADALGFDTRHRAFGHHDIMNCNHANSNFAIIICLHSFLNLLFDFSFLYLSYLLFFWCHEKKGTFFSMSNQISFYKVLSKWFHSKNGDGFNLTLSDSNSWPKKMIFGDFLFVSVCLMTLWDYLKFCFRLTTYIDRDDTRSFRVSKFASLQLWMTSWTRSTPPCCRLHVTAHILALAFKNICPQWAIYDAIKKCSWINVVLNVRVFCLCSRETLDNF